jgi:hypothetical protein
VIAAHTQRIGSCPVTIRRGPAVYLPSGPTSTWEACVRELIADFRKFITRGNVIDLAVAVVIGTAFTNVVKALVDHIFMPVLSYVTPDEFKSYATVAKTKGFLLVSASPLTRSSHHAGEDFAELRAARLARHA